MDYRTDNARDVLCDIDRRLKDIERRLLCEEEPRLNNPSRPTKAEVKVHFATCGRSDEEADYEGFYDHYEAVNWRSGTGQQITNWKAKASEWMRTKPKPKPEERKVIEPPKPPESPTVAELKRQRRENEGNWAPCPEDVKEKLRSIGLNIGRRME